MRNKYINEIELLRKRIKNSPNDFIENIKQLPWRGYQVESLKDGRKIVIVKPGGKRPRKKERHDFLVLVKDKGKKELWQLKHNQLYEDLLEKVKANTKNAKKILVALEKVYNGAEPNEVLRKLKVDKLPGEPADLILKAYKWIWAQEDINYPPPKFKGRAFSFEGWKYDYEAKRLYKTRKGIIHLIKRVNKKWSKKKP